MNNSIDSRDSLIVLLRDKYEHEYNRKKYFDDALGIPITLSSFLVGGIYFVVNDSSNSQHLTVQILFAVLIVSLVIACIFTFVSLFKVYFTSNNLYSSFPDSELIGNYYVDLRKHYLDCGKTEGSEELENCINNHLKDETIKWYIHATTKNLELNEIRGQNFINAKKRLGYALILGSLVFLLTCINKSVIMAKQTNEQKPVPAAPAIRRDKASKPNVSPSTTKK